MDAVTATSSPLQWTSTASYNDSAWKTDAVTSALSTLNDAKASASDQLSAYTTIQSLIQDPNSGSGPARYAVVQDQGFTNFAAKITSAQSKLNTNGDLSKSASIFDNMSPDEQKLASYGSHSNVSDFSDNLKLRAQFGQIVANIQKKYGITSLDQLNDNKFDDLKGLAALKGGADWLTRAQQILPKYDADATTSSPAKDTVTLSPQAQNLVSLKDLAQPNTASGGDVALHLLSTTAKTVGDVGAASKPQPFKTYQPGDVVDNKA